MEARDEKISALMSLPSLNTVRFFEAAARWQSFKKAAEELSVSPTAVSHQIRKLEEWLGVELFYREVSGVELTASGRELFDVSSRAISDLGEVVSRIKHERDFLTVRTTSSFASLWLLPRIEHFYEYAPSVDLEIITSESPEVKSRERLNEISIRFGDVAEIDPKLLLANEQYNLFCSADYLELNRGFPEPFTVFLSQWKNRDLPRLPIEKFRAENNLSDGRVKIVNFDQEIFCVQQAIAGKGMVFGSKTLCSQLLTSGLLVAAGWDSVDSELGFYFKEGPEQKSWAALQFFDWIDRTIRSSSTCQG